MCVCVGVGLGVCGNVQENCQCFISLSIGGLEVLVFVRNATFMVSSGLF